MGLQSLCNFRAFVSLNTLSSVKLSCNKCKRFTIHHRRHFAQCPSLRSFLYDRHFFNTRRTTSNLQEASGTVSVDAVSTRCSCTSRTTRANNFRLAGSIGDRVRGSGFYPMLLYLQDYQGEQLPTYRKHRGPCPWTRFLPDAS